MRAWVLQQIVGPDGYRLGDVAVPEPGPGEVRVALRAAALNHLDLWVSRGKPAPSLPHVAGADGAGVIDALGPGVAGVAPGDEVVINPTITCGVCADCRGGDRGLCERIRIVGEHRWGTFADHVVVSASNVLAKPASLSWPEAAAFGAVTATAVRMLRRARLAAGETVVVAGAGGGMGSAGVAVAAALGADVLATSTSERTRERAFALGARAAFDSADGFADEVREATDGRGADIAFEHVGPATWDQSIRCLRRGGRLVTCGGTTGPDVGLSLPFLFWRQLEVIGSTMAGPDEFAEAVALVGDGRVPVAIDEVVGFEELPAALAALDEGGRFGKVVISHEP